MVYVTFLICVIFLLLSLKKSDNFYNPTVLFMALWVGILFLNMLGAFGINRASNGAYFYILIGLCALFFGNILGQNTRMYSLSFGRKYKKSASYEIRYNIIYFLMFLTAFFLILDLRVVVNALLHGDSLTIVRTWYTATYGSGANPIEARRGYVEQVVRVILIEPFLSSLPILCAINLYSSKRKKFFLIFSMVLLVFNVVASGGGRLSILTYAITFILGFFIYKRKFLGQILNVKKYKKWIMIFSVIGVIAVIFLTLKRSSTGVIEEIYYYFGMCIPLFDRWIPYIKNSIHTYGLLSFFGIIRIPFLIMEKLGLDVPMTYEIAQKYILQANNFYVVGARSGNSFVSPFYYLYLDAGIFGIILGMFIFGVVSAVLYRRVRQSMDDKRIYFLLLIAQMSLLSFIRWQFIGTSFAMAFIYAIIYFKKTSRKTDSYE